jgi:cyclic pyranopterin phosphate synthase
MPPEGIINKPHEELLTFEEIARLVRIFASLGISKIRLTGGEPLVRKGIVNLIESLIGIDGVEEVLLTTNGTLLSFYVEELKRTGLKRINISLDTLKEDKFKEITRNNSFYRVLEGIGKAKEANFYPLKLNVVVMRGINEDEIIDFVDFALSGGLILRFIEFMNVTPLWSQEYFIPIQEVKRICESRFRLRRIGKSGPGPATYYEIGKDGILGFINTNEDNCRICNRLRITSTGELKICLYETQGFCLRGFLREGLIDEEIKDIIRARAGLKKDIDYKDGKFSQLYMCKVGG